MYKYNLISSEKIKLLVNSFIEKKEENYKIKKDYIYKDIIKFFEDNGVSKNQEILQIISELDGFEIACKEGNLTDEEIKHIKNGNFDKISNKSCNSLLQEFLNKHYRSVNDFFIRKINYSKFRNIISPEKKNMIVSPCDSRCLIYNNVDSKYDKLLVKNKKTNYRNILIGNSNKETLNIYSVVVFRLATVDYHYCHSPINCKLVEFTTINSSSYYSVQPNIIDLKDAFLKNKRHVLKLRSDNNKDFYMIVVGAIGVDSIEYFDEEKKEYYDTFPTIGRKYKKGEPMSRFNWGGSTIILMFNKDVENFNEKIVQNSNENYETYVKVRSTEICSI